MKKIIIALTLMVFACQRVENYSEPQKTESKRFTRLHIDCETGYECIYVICDTLTGKELYTSHSTLRLSGRDCGKGEKE